MLGIKSNISSRFLSLGKKIHAMKSNEIFLSIEAEVNRRRLYKRWKIYILYIWELV
jgi:hypothetical protein